MAVGENVTRANVDETMRDLASTVIAVQRAITDVADWNTRTPQADLEDPAKFDPPYTDDEAFLIKAVIDRLSQAAVWLQGGPVPPDSHNTISDLRRFTGMRS